jgi:hypothetical protein
MKKINCFLAGGTTNQICQTTIQLKQSNLVNEVFILSSEWLGLEGLKNMVLEKPYSTQSIKAISKNSDTQFSLISLNDSAFSCGQFALERLVQTAEETGASMVYADYFEVKNGQLAPHPVIDYQEGSLRDDFNFGPVQLFRNDVLKYLKRMISIGPDCIR